MHKELHCRNTRAADYPSHTSVFAKTLAIRPHRADRNLGLIPFANVGKSRERRGADVLSHLLYGLKEMEIETSILYGVYSVQVDPEDALSKATVGAV